MYEILILTLHTSQYQKHSCEERDIFGICIWMFLWEHQKCQLRGLGINQSPGGFRVFVTAARLWYCVVGLSVSSHNAQNFRVFRRNILVKPVNYRFKTLSTFKNNSSTPRSFHAFTFSISHLWYYKDEVERKVFWKNLLHDKCFHLCNCVSVFIGLLSWFKLISHSPLYILILSKMVKILAVSYVLLLSPLPS